ALFIICGEMKKSTENFGNGGEDAWQQAGLRVLQSRLTAIPLVCRVFDTCSISKCSQSLDLGLFFCQIFSI
ncbi:MAG: hypothetical protein LUE87_00385, partial [Lachnospiraceae bacterium]|nr:hypothetical protein [Lachnospiraceae bacterium]